MANHSTPPMELPTAVANELAGYMRSALFAPLSSNITHLRTECETTMQNQKDILQDSQAQISTVIEPTAERLIPVAEELKDVYRQIDLLESLLLKTSDNIKQITHKVEATEAALRKDERALNEGKPLHMWKEQEQVLIFRAKDYVENGRLKELGSGSASGSRSPVRPGTPLVKAS
ncbi:Similar to hypothetical protein [Tuber melanosporum Mel28]; acc. no. XP_002838443 [Pyronema omphalodes CBS 100304]|uniref:Uncharacterized protein n=1 Tax=Pyronema omphalodes (strain CBS 100304) TaxID=1076935 RepID=U4LPE5_PYROM|nr:Similar to hypothetical protein [Tuber melanosporum Mel28]; acc. no. XP_002838443 [Pyronema omphalodes CBS 100304]